MHRYLIRIYNGKKIVREVVFQLDPKSFFLNLGISVYVAVSRVIPYSEPVCITSKTGCPMCIVELTSRTSPILL